VTSPLAELLSELVAIPSLSGSEAGAAAACMAHLVNAKIDAELVDSGVLARLELGRGPSLMLASHLDTVPPGEGWTRDPYAARWEDGRLCGRGSNDAKASAAAMLWTLLEIAKAPWRGPKGEIWLALNACEETTNSGMAAVLERTGTPDGAVVGEPTGLEVVRAQGGLAVIEARWCGLSCHAAHVSRVEHANALLAAARELARLPAWLELPGEHPLLGKSTVVPTLLRAGERHNVVPDRAEALFDARIAPPHRAGEVAALLAGRLPEAVVSVRSERLQPVETPAGHPLVRAALACAGKVAAIGSSTLSDMALLSGVPAVKCGPGRTERSHVPDEFVLESELDSGAAFYRDFVPAALEALAHVPAEAKR
jgi:acetylornithine deacetylase